LPHDFTAVGVEIAVARVAVLRRAFRDQQQLIEADAAASIGPAANQLGTGRRPVRGPFDDHEVVAEAVHLCERELHRGGSQR
jgi:hypothetical protein